MSASGRFLRTRPVCTASAGVPSGRQGRTGWTRTGRRICAIVRDGETIFEVMGRR